MDLCDGFVCLSQVDLNKLREEEMEKLQEKLRKAREREAVWT